MNYGNLTKRHFKPPLKRAGLSQDFRLYDLRHSCATLLLADGVNVKVVSERLGHANIKMTLETYTHVLPGMQEGATEQMSKMPYG
jgi:integrase